MADQYVPNGRGMVEVMKTHPAIRSAVLSRAQQIAATATAMDGAEYEAVMGSRGATRMRAFAAPKGLHAKRANAKHGTLASLAGGM